MFAEYFFIILVGYPLKLLSKTGSNSVETSGDDSGYITDTLHM